MVAALLLPVGITTAADPASALPKEGDPITVEIAGQEPLNPVPGGAITFRGSITNSSDRTVEDLQVLLRVSSEPLGSRSEVNAVTDLTTSRRGVTISSTLTAVADELAAGTTAPFSITAPTSALPLGINGVYAFFVEARAASIGSFDTAIPVTWFPHPEELTPSRIVAASELRAPVDLTANNVLVSSTLLSSMANGGPLSNVATAGASAGASGIPISWLIDPAVTEAAVRLTDGSASFAASVSDVGAAKDSVAAWLRLVEEGASAVTSRTYLAPYAEVDASGVIDAGQLGLLDQSIAASPQAASAALPRQIEGLIAIPPGGNTSAGTLSAYAQRGVRQVVLASSALPTAQSLSYTPSGVAEVALPDGTTVTAIIPDDRLTAGLARPAATPAEQFRLQQGILADAAMISLELPLSSRTVVLLPEQGLNLAPGPYAGVLTALSQAPYTQLVDLPALLSPDVPRVGRNLALDPVDSDRLTTEYLSPIPGIEARLTAFSGVTVDPLAFESDFRAAILRSSSAHWRDDIARGQALLASVETDLTVEEQKVTTVSTGTVTFSGNVGNLPLTISNELDQAVEVGVLLQADPAVRLTFTPPGLVLIDAAKRVSIEIPVEVYGSGPLPVSVILTDRDGRPFITTGDLVIKSTATSMVAAAVAVVGAVTLVAMIVLRFRRKGTDQL